MTRNKMEARRRQRNMAWRPWPWLKVPEQPCVSRWGIVWQSGNGLGGWKTVGRQWGPIHTASQRAVLSRGSLDDGGGAGGSLVSPQESAQVPRVPWERADALPPGCPPSSGHHCTAVYLPLAGICEGGWREERTEARELNGPRPDSGPCCS